MAADPLAGLFQRIQDATVIPPPSDYRPDNNDPIFRLINENEQSKPQKISPPKTTQSGELSQRTRLAISNRPLQGQARLEAVDLAIQTLKNPNKEQIEKILDILISG